MASTGLSLLPVALVSAAPTSDQDKAKIKSAIQALKAEADQIDQLKQGSLKPRFRRPHPALRSFGDDLALPVLSEMTRSLAANDYRDTYIKWHLMHVASRSGRAERRDVTEILIRLLKEIPGPLDIKRRKEYSDEPAEIAKKYWSLHRKSAVKVGYPPFVKTYYGRSAIQYVGQNNKAKWTKMADELERLRKLWKRTPNKDNIAFNNRIEGLGFIVRKYRGELIYELLQTGDPKVLRLIANAIEGNVKSKHMIAFDLLAYVYTATNDGVLSGFPQKDLEEFGRDIKRIARSSEGHEKYKVSSDWARFKAPPRNFADYAFHLIHMLENLDINALPVATPS